MRTFLFYDRISGEEFLVESENKGDAMKIAKRYFNKPTYIDEVSDLEADILGYDTY